MRFFDDVEDIVKKISISHAPTHGRDVNFNNIQNDIAKIYKNPEICEI